VAFGGRRNAAAQSGSGRCASRSGTIFGSRIVPIRLRVSACTAGRPAERWTRALVFAGFANFAFENFAPCLCASVVYLSS